MKKIININLSGRVIPIEDSAYESLQRYIESLRRYFMNEEGRDEIINDIESRVAELMNDKIKKGSSAITDSDIEEIITSMGRVEDFEDVDAAETVSGGQQTSGTQTATASAYTQTQTRRARGRLYRDASDKLLGGVCSGIANYMNFDPAIVRLLFAIITFGGFGMGILIYIILWIILPARNLDTYVGKRLFRNPDDKIISGVAGGLGAYFNQPTWIVRLVFAAPLILNIVFGVFNRIFFAFDRDIFPNLFIGSFTGTFILAYIILWIVLPEAKSSFEKMEMRGERVDVNSIRQNVKDEMENLRGRAQAWGEEVRESAEQLGQRAREFANTRGRAFAGEMAEATRPVARGLGHVIGVLFKAFFVFVAGTIALSLFAMLMVIIFGGVAWSPINNFLWSSPFQKMLAWGTILFFITLPVIAFMTWLIRRLIRVRTKNHYLSWTFGGLWVIGLVCAIMLGASIAKDLRVYERISSDVQVTQPVNGNLIVRVPEPEIRYTGEGAWWFHNDGSGWDLTEDTMRYNNVKLRVVKSDDSAYHVVVNKYSAGKSIPDARTRAANTQFNIYSQDSILNLGNGVAIGRGSKFRGQGVIVEVHVPVGKKIRFDESLMQAYSPGVVRRFDRTEYNRYWRYRYKMDWDMDEYFNWETNVDYIMTENGLVSTMQKKENTENSQNLNNKDSLRQIREEQKRVRDSIDKELKKTERELRQRPNRKTTSSDSAGEVTTQVDLQFPYFSVLI
jgi:phage shock protein PspC (stress-responsive transcriptional regulator)